MGDLAADGLIQLDRDQGRSQAVTRARYEGIPRVNVLPRRQDVQVVDLTQEKAAAWVASRSRTG